MSIDMYKVKVCVTAQHREMLDQVLELFDIQPDVDLNLMRPGQDLTEITSSVMLGLRRYYEMIHQTGFLFMVIRQPLLLPVWLRFRES